MARLRFRIESVFARSAVLIFRHRLKTLAIVLAALAALMAQIPHMKFDTSTESFFRKDDPALIAYDRFRQQFGRDEFIVVAIDPPEVFDRAFLAKLRDYQQALQAQVPHLKEVNSLITVRDTRGEAERLVVEDLVKELPQTPQAMAALRQRVLSSELYPNLFISADGRFTTVLIETQAFSGAEQPGDLAAGFGAVPQQGAGTAADKPRQPLTDEENSRIVRAVEQVSAQFAGPDFPIHLSGSPIVTDFLKRAMQSNMARLMALAVLAIGLFLLVLFRRLSGVLLPLLVVLLSVAATVGAMAALGTPFTLPLMILPSFLLAVGVGATVHLLSMFYRNFEHGLDKEEALSRTLGHSGLPIVMTSLTTAAGLLSFVTASLASVASLGVFASLGVTISLLLTLVLIPALLALLPLRRHARFARREEGVAPFTDRLLMGLGAFANRRARAVVLASLLLTAVAATGLPYLRFSHNTLVWFPKSGEFRQATELIDRELRGSISVELVIDTGRENGLYDPAVMNKLDALARYAETYTNVHGVQFVGKTNSVADVLKEINRALHENRQAFYAIPQERDLIAQELLLFENSGNDDLQRLVDTQFRMARLTIKSPWDDAAAYVQFVRDLQAKGNELFGGSAQVTVTGLIRLFTASILALMHSMVTSYTLAFVVITLLMILLVGRLGLGLLSMVPNLLPIVITLGFMGWADIPLDAFTLLIGSIALGLAVDDTIHFFHNFQRYYGQTGDATYAVHETLLTSGRAMLFTTLVLVTGFWLFMFASLNNLYYFGLLTGLTLLVALAADLLLSPAILTLVAGRVRAPAGEAAPARVPTALAPAAEGSASDGQ